MAAPTKLQFEACSKTIIRKAKNALQKNTCTDLNDHFLHESNNSIEKLHFLQNRCRPTNMSSEKRL